MSLAGFQSNGSYAVPSPFPTFHVPFGPLTPTAAVDLISIKPPTGKIARIRQISISTIGSQTTAGVVALKFGTCTAVGTGGSGATEGTYGIGDGDMATSGSTVRTGDTTQGAGFVQMGQLCIFVPATAAVTIGIADLQFHAEHRPPSVSGDAAACVFNLRHPGVTGGAGLSGFVEYTLEPV